MDTSENYIKMCEVASEIQGAWKPSRADFVIGAFIGYMKDVGIVPNIVTYAINPLGEDSEYGKYAWYFQHELVWLPRQDQLQEMVTADGLSRVSECAAGLIESFYQWWGVYSQHHYSTRESMEQLWLIFVMKEKYNKEWNGEEWINQE